MINEPNLDTVEVIRCRECQYYPEINCFGRACCNMIIDQKVVLIPRNPNDYCSYGKHRTVKEESKTYYDKQDKLCQKCTKACEDGHVCIDYSEYYTKPKQ